MKGNHKIVISLIGVFIFLVVLGCITSFAFAENVTTISVPIATITPISAIEDNINSNLSSTNVDESSLTQVYIFYSETCPHCKAELKFMKEIESQCGGIKINYILYSQNESFRQQMADKYNTTIGGVPQTFIGDKVFIGFTPETGPLEYNQFYKAYIGYQNQIQESLFALSTNNPANLNNQNATCTNPTKSGFNISTILQYLVFVVLVLYGVSYIFFRNKFKEKPKYRKIWMSVFLLLLIISVFVLIKSFSATSIKDFAVSLPFPLFVTIIALADGFNPCAFTVLIILLSLLTYTKSRRDMAIIGITFIIGSAIMYFTFIMVMIVAGAWLLPKFSNWITLALGIGITIAAVINIKDYFFFNKGVSLSISDDNKMKFTTRARNIVQHLQKSDSGKALFLAILGTFVLAVFVNIIELGCTAILPAIFMTSLLKTYGTTLGLMQVFWTALYSIIYIIPLFAILFNFIYYFKSTRLTEKQGRILKLITGIFMLVFGLIMLFNPGLLVLG